MAKAEIALSAVDQTKAAFASAQKNLQGLGAQAQALPAKFGTIGIALAGVFSAATLKGAIDVLDRLDDLSEKSGVTVENLSALRYAGEVTGTSFESLGDGLTKLSKNMAEAAGGGKEAAAAFKSVGIEVTNNAGGLRSQDEILNELADRFAGYEDGAAKAALAQKIFGKSGADMIPLLNQGSEGIARLRKEAEGLGAVYGGELAKAGAQFNDNLKKLELNAEAAKVSLAGGLLPALNSIIEAFIRLKEAGQVWTIIKDAAKDVVGLGKMTNDPGADVERLKLERLRKERDIDFAKRKGLPTRDLESDLFPLDQLIEASKIRQAGRALKDNGDTSDALTRRRRLATAKTQAPIVPGGDGSAAKAANKELEEQAKLLLELSGLTGTFSEDWARLNAIYAKGGISLKQLTEAQAALLAKQPAIKAQLELEQKIGEARAKNAEITEKHLESLTAENEQIVKSNQALREQNEEIGLSAEALNLLRMARLDANIAREEELLLIAQGVDGNEGEVAALERKINLLRQERMLKGEGAAKEIRAAEQEDAKKRTATISESISDGVLDGFRNSKSIADVFWTELKAQAGKTILQPIINPIVQAGQDFISGALKGGGGGGGGGLGDLFGLATSLFGGFDSTALPTGDFARMDRLSFDGGGYTGPGLRAGGLDGKGGFMAMLHPDETVVDHTRGQKTSSGSTTINNLSFGAGVSRAEAYEGYRRAKAEAVSEVRENGRRRRG